MAGLLRLLGTAACKILGQRDALEASICLQLWCSRIWALFSHGNLPKVYFSCYFFMVAGWAAQSFCPRG